MMVKRVARRLLILVAVLALLTGTTFWAFRNVGRWLVVDDALQPARAIVVLTGLTPYRAMETAGIYREGWAPEVWLLKDEPRGADEAFANLGTHHITEEEYDTEVLERLGVPKSAIRIFDPPATNTKIEFEVAQDELRQKGGDRIILVTSPLHTRRVRAIWGRVVGTHPAGPFLARPRSLSSSPFAWPHSSPSDAPHSGLILM